jgi:hypothetical protein
VREPDQNAALNIEAGAVSSGPLFRQYLPATTAEVNGLFPFGYKESAGAGPGIEYDFLLGGEIHLPPA